MRYDVGMHILAVANSKGGTGKTTTVRHLANELAKNHRVLLIDLDPQASLTESLELPQDPAYTIGHVFTTEKHFSNIIITINTNLFLAPASPYLVSAENALRESASGILKLRNALKNVSSQYDYCVIDTVGTTSLLVFNALIAAHAVIIPTRPEGTDLKVLVRFVRDTVMDINENYHDGKLKIAILPNQYTDQSTHHKDAIEALKKSGLTLLPMIGRSVKVSEAMSQKKTVGEYDKDNARSTEYQTLAREVITWLKNQ